MYSMSSRDKYDLLMCCAAVLLLRELKRKRKRCGTKSILKKRKEDNLRSDLRMEDGAGFRNFARMCPADFELLANLIGPKVAKQDTSFREAIPLNDRLAITLRFLATGDSYECLMYLFKVSKQSISKIIPEVCKAIAENLSQYLKSPTCAEEWLKVAEEFNKALNFPHCIGVIDGKHIPLRPPAFGGSQFHNYNGCSISNIVLMTIVDANYNFRFANVGCQEKISDGGEFRNTLIYKRLVGNDLRLPPIEPLPGREMSIPYVYVADDTFPMHANITKPYADHQVKVKGSKERLFNYRLSRARMVAENTIGVMSSVFQIFGRPLSLDPNKSALITLSCICLHNFLRRNALGRSKYTPSGTFDAINTDNGDIIPGTWRANNVTAFTPLKNVPRRSTTDALNIRNEFAEYFRTPNGRVCWQDNYT